jgi:hypothetical protein
VNAVDATKCPEVDQHKFAAELCELDRPRGVEPTIFHVDPGHGHPPRERVIRRVDQRWRHSGGRLAACHPNRLATYGENQERDQNRSKRRNSTNHNFAIHNEFDGYANQSGQLPGRRPLSVAAKPLAAVLPAIIFLAATHFMQFVSRWRPICFLNRSQNCRRRKRREKIKLVACRAEIRAYNSTKLGGRY